MGLKQCHHTPPGGARRRKRRFDLSWMMTVIIHDQHAVLLALDLEPSLGSPKPREHLGDVFKLHPQIEPNRHRGKSVENVVKSGHRELNPSQIATKSSHCEFRTEICIQMDPGRGHIRLRRRTIADRPACQLRYDRL